jgi:hypothetical protein
MAWGEGPWFCVILSELQLGRSVQLAPEKIKHFYESGLVKKIYEIRGNMLMRKPSSKKFRILFVVVL